LNVEVRMIKKDNENGSPFFVGKHVSLAYKDKKWTKKCGDWCKKYLSCNLKIIEDFEKPKDLLECVQATNEN